MASVADTASQVLLFTPGEVSAEYYTGYLTNRTLMGMYAQALGGAMILFERKCSNGMANPRVAGD